MDIANEFVIMNSNMKGKINVDMENMPPYLSERLIDEWVERFSSLVKASSGIDVSALAAELEVTFSLDEIEECYGDLSLKEAKDKVKGLFRKMEIKEWQERCLAEIETKEDLLRSAKEPEWPLQKLHEEEHGGCTVFDRIQEIASSVKFCVLRLGEYRHKKREIVLYVNSIERTRKNNVEQAFEKVFAHELFHAFHYFYLHNYSDDNDILRRTDATRSVVLESLASYYEKMYCERYMIHFDDWVMWGCNEPAVFPYAGAKYIKDDQEFREILDHSCDLDVALRELLFNSDYKREMARRQFYSIKNSGVVKKTVKSRKKDSAIDVCNYCMKQLNAKISRQSPHYFNTDKMREFFERHGEEIGNKMRIVCQKETKGINIYLETQGGSPALDRLWADSRIRALRNGTSSYCLISRVTVIGLDELDDCVRNGRPFSDIEHTIDLNLQEFKAELFDLENILDSL